MKMNKSLHITLAVLISSFFACEKVIEYPVNDANSTLVVEAVAKNLPGASYVLLTQTIGLYDDPNTIKYVSGASVEVVDPFGTVYVFSEDESVEGKYAHEDFQILPNQTYDLKVDYDGGVFTSQSTAMNKPQVDSIFTFQQIGTDDLGNPDTTHFLFYTVTDDPDEKNFYHFVLWVNGEKDDELFIETDDLGNGQTYTSPFFGITFDAGDSVYAELWSMQKENYAYFSALFTNLNQSPFSAAPSDLPSNIEGEGIGCFGAFMVDTASVVFP